MRQSSLSQAPGKLPARSRIGAAPRGAEGRPLRHPLRAVLLLLLLLLAAAAAALVPTAHAIPFRMQGGTIDRPITVGDAVDSVSLDGVRITNAVPVVLDVAAMLPGAVDISVTNCVCDGGAQIYVLGHTGEPAGNRSLVVDISALDGRFCSVVIAHRMPARTTVTIRDSTIVTSGAVSYQPLRGAMADAVAPPLALFRPALTSSQLRVENTVLRTAVAGGMALYVSGGALRSSAVVLDNVTLEAAAGAGSLSAYAMYVAATPALELSDSVLSVTRASVESSGRGLSFGGVSLLQSVLRVVGVVGRVAAAEPLVACGGGSIGGGAWLDVYGVLARSAGSPVASLAAVTLDGGAVSIARCVTDAAALAVAPAITSGAVTVQCNRAGGKVLQSSGDYRAAGLPSVTAVPCGGGSCAEALSCFAPATAGFANCACSCTDRGAGAACLPLDVPLWKAGGGGGGQQCVAGGTVTESAAVGSGNASVCFDAVVFRGPISVTVDMAAMDPFADALSVTLRNCVLEGGAMLRINGIADGGLAQLPAAAVRLTGISATEGTIVLAGGLPINSTLLLENSTLLSSVAGSQHVPATGPGGVRYGPALVLDGVRLVHSQFVIARTSMACTGAPCSCILVERSLTLDQSSAFYMDNSRASAPSRILYFISSDLRVGEGSVFSVQNTSWTTTSSLSDTYGMYCNNIVVSGGGVLQFSSSKISVRFAVVSTDTLTLRDGSWMVQRDNVFRTYYALAVRRSPQGVEFHNRSVWSIMNNAFKSGIYEYFSYLCNNFSVVTSSSRVYGRCNTQYGSPVADYAKLRFNMKSGTISVLPCNSCEKDAMCFSDRTSSMSGCDCVCAAGGYGDVCLPAPVPDGLGPLPAQNATAEIPCVYGGTVSSLTIGFNGLGLCFVDVEFDFLLSIDMELFEAESATVNITLLRCTFPGLKITGNGGRVYVNVTSSRLTEGSVEVAGSFGAYSELMFVDNFFSTPSTNSMRFGYVSFATNSTLLLLRNVIDGENRGLFFASNLVLDGCGVTISGNTITARSESSFTFASIFINTFDIKNGGYFNAESNTMSGGSGLYVQWGGAVSSSSVFRMENCTFIPKSVYPMSKLIFLQGNFILRSGAQLRVINNRMSSVPLLHFEGSYVRLSLLDANTIAVIAQNTMHGSGDLFTGFEPSQIDLRLPAQFVLGCNKVEGTEVSYKGVFPDTVSTFSCGTCNNNAACYMPLTHSVDNMCKCDCKTGGHGPSCVPFETPDIPLVPVPEKPVDTSTSCVVDQTLTSLALNMWKTHHCYVGVIFRDTGAVATFELAKMPLRYPINITFSGCTFMGGAALHFVGVTGGSGDSGDSVGVFIRVVNTTMWSSIVSFSGGLPKLSNIAVTTVNAVQATRVPAAGMSSTYYSVVLLSNIVLSGSSSLLISNINATVRATDSSSGVFAAGITTIRGGSSLYVRYSTFTGYWYALYLYELTISDNSVLGFLNNTMPSGSCFIYQYNAITISDHSVFRMVGNTGDVKNGIVLGDKWNVQTSSWLDWQNNNVGSGAMFYMFLLGGGVSVDQTSVMTLKGWTARSTGLAWYFKLITVAHKFYAGCLWVDGRVLATATDLNNNYINSVTNVEACGECSKDGDCFGVRTASVSNCACSCSSGGYGDVCVPAPVPDGRPPPPPPPEPPKPPAPGECINNTEYPEVRQSLGAGLSWLCYSNVTFRGGGTSISVPVGAMKGTVVSITFERCRWENGAVLAVIGGQHKEAGEVSIAITGNTFTDALLFTDGTFTARTTLIVSGNFFSTSRIISPPGMTLSQQTCIAMDRLEVTDHSTVAFVRNTFQTAGTSRAIHSGSKGITVSGNSQFVLNGNTFALNGDGSTAVYCQGSSSAPSLKIYNNSAVVIESNAVLKEVKFFIHLYYDMDIRFLSALVFRGNDVVFAQTAFESEYRSLIEDYSWLLFDANTGSGQMKGSLVNLLDGITFTDSTIAVSKNDLTKLGSMPTVVSAGIAASTTVNSTFLAACNTVNGVEVTTYSSVPPALGLQVSTCGEGCRAAASCFPARTESASVSDCVCTCADGGYGAQCLPVAVPEVNESDVDPCVRDAWVGVDVRVGSLVSTVCYVGVTFAGSVVVDVEAMAGAARNVTLVGCTLAGGAALHVSGWRGAPGAGQRADVWISGLEARGGGGVLLAGRFPAGSRVTVVDSTFVAAAAVAYGRDYDLRGASAPLVLHRVGLAGAVLTVARTHVAALFAGARGVLVSGGVTLSDGGALHVAQLSVQTALGRCVSVEDGAAAVEGGSVLAIADSDFLLCGDAVSVAGDLSVRASVVALMNNTFASAAGYGVALQKAVSLSAGAALLVRGNVHDSDTKELLRAAGAASAAGGSTLSFAANEGLYRRMLSLSVALSGGARLLAACNRVAGVVPATAAAYAAAGFGDASRIVVVACGACDRDAYCYAPGAAAAAAGGGGDGCVCECTAAGHGAACVPVAPAALPPAPAGDAAPFVVEGATVRAAVAVPRGVAAVTLRNAVLDGAPLAVYVPWTAPAGVRIVVQNVSLRNGAVLYVLGGARRPGAGPRSSSGGGAVELSACGVDAFNGAVVLSGAFPAGSALAVADSVMVTAAAPAQLLGTAAAYAPALVLWNLQLAQSVLVVHGAALLTVVAGGRAVLGAGAALRLAGSGVALDAVVVGGETALHVAPRAALSGGSVLRVAASSLHGGAGVALAGGVVADASAVVVSGNSGTLRRGALLALRQSAAFAGASWLALRGNDFRGGQPLVALPPYPGGAAFAQSTFTLHDNGGSGDRLMDGVVAAGGGMRFVVGCLRMNGNDVQSSAYDTIGVVGHNRPPASCGSCSADVQCFPGGTRSVVGCRCRCADGAYGRDCLPAYLPRPDGCARLPPPPLPSRTATPAPVPTPTRTRSLTPPTPTATASQTYYTPPPPPTPTATATRTVPPTPTRTASATASATPSLSVVAERRDAACPALAVTTLPAGGLTQDDIRSGAAGPVRLLAALPPPLRWASDPNLSALLRFARAPAAAQPHGYSGPWGALLRNATWQRSATSPFTVLELAVPLHADYFISVDEEIFIRASADAVAGGCNGVLLGSFTVASSTPQSLTSMLSVVNGAVAAAATVAVLVAGGLGSVLEIQTLGVFATMSCASAQERTSSVALPYFLSVFAHWGPLWMVVGNALVTAVFAAAHYGLTLAVARWRGVDIPSARATMRFPSLSYLIAYIMHLGIFVCSVFLLAMPDAAAQHYVVGVLGTAYGIAFPVLTRYYIAHFTGTSFIKYWQFAKKPFYERWLYPIGYWAPAAHRQMYGSVFTNMKGSYVFWCVFHLSVLSLVGLVAAIVPPTDKCHIQYFCMAALLLAGAGVTAFTSMMRSGFLTVMHTASFVLLAVLCMINSANYLAPNDSGVQAYAAIILILMAVLLVTTVYSAGTWYMEERRWQSLREPRRGGLDALLNGDGESDGASSFCSAGTGESYSAPVAPLRESTHLSYSDGSFEYEDIHLNPLPTAAAVLPHPQSDNVSDTLSILNAGPSDGQSRPGREVDDGIL